MGDSASQFEKPIVFKKGKVIFVEGEPSAFLYVIVSGEIMIFKEGKAVSYTHLTLPTICSV